MNAFKMLGMLQRNRVPVISTGALGAKSIMEKKVLEASDIDATHSNAFTRWLEMGSPKSPTSAQLAELNKASELTMQEGISYQDVKDDNCSWNLT